MEDSRIVRGRQALEKQMLARRMRREMTPGEWCLWQRLRANRFCGLHFRRQQVIDGFIADFYCHAARLVVEADGDVHDDRWSTTPRVTAFLPLAACVFTVSQTRGSMLR